MMGRDEIQRGETERGVALLSKARYLQPESYVLGIRKKGSWFFFPFFKRWTGFFFLNKTLEIQNFGTKIYWE